MGPGVDSLLITASFFIQDKIKCCFKCSVRASDHCLLSINSVVHEVLNGCEILRFIRVLL